MHTMYEKYKSSVKTITVESRYPNNCDRGYTKIRLNLEFITYSVRQEGVGFILYLKQLYLIKIVQIMYSR